VLTGLAAIGTLAGAVTITLVLALGGQALVHRRFADADLMRHNEVGGIMLAVVGTLYAVVLGFLTVVSWEHVADARRQVVSEAAAATDAWHSAAGLPTAQRVRIRQDLMRYAELMVNGEWVAMDRGGFDGGGDIIVMDAIGTVATFTPANAMESNAQAATLGQLSTLHDTRQIRLAENAAGLSWFEWLILGIGAACVICFCWLFGLANRRVHMLMTAAVTVLITCLLVLLFELQYPFRGALRIGPDSWVGVIDHINMMRAHPLMNMRM
jgi:hypothetical protein